jgi:hypothetical protein
MVIPQERAGNLLSFANSFAIRSVTIFFFTAPRPLTFFLTWHGIVNCDAVRIKFTLNFNNTNGTVENDGAKPS